ncbi:hypothetical protein TWF718_008530 [Orbilia javanica]|uniref:Exonuclease domain-containing protein n=1 Tax=Orbilia javanica TaxID=47235 RepID=A0AAN8N5G7_9PEZI
MPGVAVCPSERWSKFPFSSEQENSLRRFLLHREKRKRYGYRTEKFSNEELLHKHEAYCKRCDAFALKPDDSVAYQQQLQCRIHPGKKLEQVWSCCRSTIIEYPGQPSGCRIFPRHDWDTTSALPQKFWELHHTPKFTPSGRNKKARKAVSLDCEMATNRFDQPELIKLTLVDFFTQEVLIDCLVKPLVKIKNMITQIHGITYKDIISASNASTAIIGRDAARKKIFEFVGPETMVFVHGGTNDFLCLRWLHPAIVDTQEIESRVKRIGDDELDDWLDDEGTGLEAMCRLITGIQIRSGRTKYGHGVHDSVEDAMACRELGIWYAKNLKGEIGIDDMARDARPVSVVAAPIVSAAQTQPSHTVLEPSDNSLPELTSFPLLGEESEQFWDCKVCNLKVPKADEKLHRREASHMATLILRIQQKGG